MSQHRLLLRELGEAQWNEVDLYLDGDAPILINKRFADLSQVGASRSSSAYNISLVGSFRTLHALGFGHRLDKAAETNALGKQYEVLYLFEGVDVLNGPAILEISQITTRGDLVVIESFLTAGRYRWLQELKDVQYRDLDLGTHLFNIDTVEESWDKGNGRDYIHGLYIPIDYGAWIAPPRVQLAEIEFSPYIKSVVEKAHELKGWSVTGGEWWDTDANWLFMPHVGKSVKGNSLDDGNTRDIVYDVVADYYNRRIPDELISECPDIVSSTSGNGTWSIIPFSEISCEVTVEKPGAGIFRIKPPSEYPQYVGPASFQAQFNCTSPTGSNPITNIVIEVEFQDNPENKDILEAELRLPIVGDIVFTEEGPTELALSSDYYEVHALDGNTPYVAADGQYKNLFESSSYYGKYRPGEYVVPFDGTYNFQWNFQTEQSVGTDNWRMNIVSDQRGTVFQQSLLFGSGAILQQFSSGAIFFNQDEKITVEIERVAGAGTLTVYNENFDGNDIDPNTLESYTPALELDVHAKVEINGDAGSNFYDNFLNDYTVVASHAHKDFNVVEMMDGLRHIFNLRFVYSVEDKVLYIYTEQEFENRSDDTSSVIDISPHVDCEGEYRESTPKTEANTSDSFCPNVKYRFKEDSNDGWVKHYQEQAGNTFLHGEKILPFPECSIEQENSFFSPTSLTLQYLGPDPTATQTGNPYTGAVGSVDYPIEYMNWFLKMAPDRDNEPDYYELARKILQDPLNFSYDNIGDETLWEGRVTHDYNFRIAWYDGMRNTSYNDYFDNFFLAGSGIQVGFPLQYYDSGLATYTSKSVSEAPYAFMIDLWGQDITKPALTFRKEAFIDPAEITINYAKYDTDYLRTANKSLFSTNNLRELYYVDTIRRYRGGRKFEVPINVGVSDLDKVFGFDTRKFLRHPELGSGVFYLDAIKSYNPETGQGTAVLWQEEPSCGDSDCYPGFESFDFAATTSHDPVADTLTTTFTLDNADAQLSSISSSEWNITNILTGASLGTTLVNGVSFGATGSQVGATLSLGSGLDFEFNTVGERNVAYTITGVIEYTTPLGTTCAHPFCYKYEARVSSVSVEQVIADELSSSCSEPPGTFSNFICLQTEAGDGSFPHQTEIELSENISTYYDSARRWEMGNFSQNGVEVDADNVGALSTFWSNANSNIEYILCDSDGAFTDVPYVIANNTRNFWKWFNSFFYNIGDDGNGLPASSQSPVLFKPKETRTLIYVSQDAGPISLSLIRRDGLGNIEFYYDFSITPSTASGELVIRDSALLEVATYNIEACDTQLPTPIPTLACQLDSSAHILGSGAEAAKWSDLTAIAGTATGSISYTVETFQVNGGSNEAASEATTINIPADVTTLTDEYTGGNGTHPLNLMEWFNALPYAFSEGVTLVDGGQRLSYVGANSYRIEIREDIFNSSTVLQRSNRFSVDTDPQKSLFGSASTLDLTTIDAGGGVSYVGCDPISVGNAVPVASGVTLNGYTVEGVTLTVSYTYSDAEGDLEGASLVEILSYPTQADAAAGTNEVVESTTGSHTIVAGDADKYFAARVTPVALTNATPGIPVLSSYEGPTVATPTHSVTLQYDGASGTNLSQLRIRVNVAQSMGIDWGDGEIETLEAGANSNLDFTHTSTVGSVLPKTATILAEADTVSFINWANQNLVGTLDISQATELTRVSLEFNQIETINWPSVFNQNMSTLTISGESALTNTVDLSGSSFMPNLLRIQNSGLDGLLFNPLGYANTSASFTLQNCHNITDLDLSMLDQVKTSATIASLDGLVSFVAPSGNSGSFNAVKLRDLPLCTSSIDLSFLGAGCTDLRVDSLPQVPSITFPNTVGSGVATTELRAFGNSLVTSYNMSNMEDLSGTLLLNDNAALATVTGASSGGEITELNLDNTPSLTSADFSGHSAIGGEMIICNSNISAAGLTIPSSSVTAVTNIDLNNSSNFGYKDFTGLTFSSSSSNFDFRNMTLNQTQVDDYLADMDSVLGAGASSIRIENNVAPSAAGLVSVSNLQTKGHTVTHD